MGNNNHTAKETSFWKFIQDNPIEIPIIQRDYAQGRLGKENLRKNFLSDLKKALDNDSPNENKVMKLDFVYGSIERDKMNPLDGQQRLTTLWLLHWYIALRAGKLNYAADTLNKFSYETRISSREFCDNLCNPKHFKDFDGNKIVSFILKQTWFYSAWKQDPTIQSMLRMLGGTKVTDKKGEDIVDGIEELFEGTDNYVNYWKKLTSDQAPIVFYHLSLKDFGLSDDLYIKMNARGKQLTSFENFKADLVGYIIEQSDSELLSDYEKKTWKSLLDETEGIPIKMDTAWTDVFWKNKSRDNKIDEIYFAFLNRFFWDQLFMNKRDGKYVLDIGKGDETSTQENENPSYKYLNNSNAGQNVYDTTISYKELGFYKYFNGEIPYNVFADLLTILNRYAEYNKMIPVCEWDDSFKFIPEYEKSNGECIETTDNSGEKIWKVTYLNQVQRIVFHAVCKYFKEGVADTESIKRWMRVVWNLVSGEDEKGRPQIRSTSAVRTAMEFIDQLDSHHVYDSLMVFKSRLYDSDFDKRCKEEIDKAKQILAGEPRSDGKSWEDVIIDVEQNAFFKGTIRFLFKDANGGVNWNDFDIKWANAQKYFDKNGVKDNYKVALTKSLVIQCTDWEKQLYDQQIFNPSASAWKWILCSPMWKAPIHNILVIDDLVNIQCSESLNDFNVDTYFTPMLESLPYKTFIEEEPTGRFRSIDGRLAYYKPYGRRYITFDFGDFQRNKMLRALNDYIIIDNDAHPEIKDSELSFWWGWDINFKYNNNFFQWLCTPFDKELDIYLTEYDWVNRKKRQVPTTNKGTDEDTYFCFRVTNDMHPNEFLTQLDHLIYQQQLEKNVANAL